MCNTPVSNPVKNKQVFSASNPQPSSSGTHSGENPRKHTFSVSPSLVNKQWWLMSAWFHKKKTQICTTKDTSHGGEWNVETSVPKCEIDKIDHWMSPWETRIKFWFNVCAIVKRLKCAFILIKVMIKLHVCNCMRKGVEISSPLTCEPQHEGTGEQSKFPRSAPELHGGRRHTFHLSVFKCPSPGFLEMSSSLAERLFFPGGNAAGEGKGHFRWGDVEAVGSLRRRIPPVCDFKPR